MKRFLSKAWPLLVIAAVMLALCLKPHPSVWTSFKDPDTARLLQQFVAEKEAQAAAATNGVPPEIRALFKDADRGDWLTLSNAFWKLGEQNGNFAGGPAPAGGKFWLTVQNLISRLQEKIGWHKNLDDEEMRLRGTPWEAAKEIWGAFNGFIEGDDKYSTAFGREIIDSIPAGSIYFGGSDPGRFIVTAMCRSQPDGDPFFTLSPNALTDMTYLEYLRGMYGNKIYIPTPTDQQASFQDYMTGAKARLASHSLKPGEDVKMGTNGLVQINSYVSVMEINGLLIKTVFDNNPGRDFFIEGNNLRDWTYPYLEPHGLIFKINRQPVEKLSDEILQKDHDFWTNQIQPMIGGWLKDETPVTEIAAFAIKTFGRGDFTGFSGDTNFIQNIYAHSMFACSRDTIAGFYEWRIENSTDDREKQHLAKAADFAYRQAWAMCPYEPETCFNYLNFLMEQGRYDDALLLAETTASLPQNKGNELMAQTVAQVRQQWQKNHASAPANR